VRSALYIAIGAMVFLAYLYFRRCQEVDRLKHAAKAHAEDMALAAQSMGPCR
jgi:hypothetical protein